MSKRVLVLLVAVAALSVIASQAVATSLPSGYMAASATDRSSLFAYDAGSGTWSPIATGADPAAGQEQRSVFSLDAINFGPQATDFFGPYVAGGGGAVPYDTNTLAGTVYDLVIGGTSPNTGKTDDLGFVPGGRYTSGGGVDGTWTDMNLSPTYGAVTSALGFGGILAVYEVPQNTADFTSGHGAWSDGTGPASSDGALTATDMYPTVTVGEPWLIAAFGPLGALGGAPLVLYEGGAVGGWQGTAYANIIGGTYADMMVQDGFGMWQDLRLDFTVTIPFDSQGGITLVDGWQTSSLDPISFGVVPEPATLSLLGFGIAGLVLRRRRKK